MVPLRRHGRPFAPRVAAGRRAAAAFDRETHVLGVTEKIVGRLVRRRRSRWPRVGAGVAASRRRSWHARLALT
jgi:hypothetical protein